MMNNKKRKTVYVDMDGVLADYKKLHYAELMREPKIAYPQSQYGFFNKLEPIENAVETYKWLDKNFNTHILTAPSVLNPLSYTEKRIWVEKYLGIIACDKMIICGYKHLLKGDFLIDDNNYGKGQDKFEGELILFDNITTNWDYIKEYLSKSL